MDLMEKTKAIRLSQQDAKLIQEFLDQNPLFDFSSLVRVAVHNFIKDPKITLTPVTPSKPSQKESPSHDRHP